MTATKTSSLDGRSFDATGVSRGASQDLQRAEMLVADSICADHDASLYITMHVLELPCTSMQGRSAPQTILLCIITFLPREREREEGRKGGSSLIPGSQLG